MEKFLQQKLEIINFKKNNLPPLIPQPVRSSLSVKSSPNGDILS